MANFALAFSAVQSADGKVITITDLSNWNTNTESYTQGQFTRNLVLTNYLGAPIVTIPLPTGTTVVTYDVPVKTNPWININYTSVGPVTLNKLQRFPFFRIFQLAYIKAIKNNCGCECVGDNTMCEVDAFYTGAEFAIVPGDAAAYQANIDSAYILLTV